MNTLSSRLLNAGAIVAAAFAPVAVFAQDTTMAVDNSSPAIGFLVVWLLAIGGLLAIGAAIFSDKRAQATRSSSSSVTTRR